MEIQFSQRLQQLMDERSLRATDFGQKINVPKSTLSMWLSGKRRPRPKKLIEISEILGVSPSWLMGYPADNDSAFQNLAETHNDIVRAYDSAPPHIKIAVRKLLDLE